MGCPPPVFDLFGRNGIAVEQPPYAGNNYPFTQPTNIADLFGDLYLSYLDNESQFVFPLRVAWVYGFGCTTVSVPITPLHTYDMRVVDANDDVVFDTTVAGTTMRHRLWGSHLRVVEWVQEDQLLRVVQHLSWRDAEAPRDFDIYEETPTAYLDNQTLSRIPTRLRSLRVPAGSQVRGDVRFSCGHNVKLDSTDVRGIGLPRKEACIVFQAEPGDGVGEVAADCSATNSQKLKSVNGQPPNAAGDVQLFASDGYRVQRPITSTTSSGSLRQVDVAPASLSLAEDSGVCWDCSDFLALYEGARRLRDRFAALHARLYAAREKYRKVVSRIEKQAACRWEDVFRVQMVKKGANCIGFSIGYSNNGRYHKCLQNVVLLWSFSYADTTGYMDPMTNPATPLTAVLRYTGQPVLDERSVFQAGAFRLPRTGSGTTMPAAPYRLGGHWPHYFAVFKAIELGETGSVIFDLSFPGIESIGSIEFVVDAYAPADTPDSTEVFPISGYTTGSGPVSAGAKLKHIAPAPRKYTTGVLASDLL